MHGHAPDFIISRILWRAGQHNLPSARTSLWENSPDWLTISLPADFENPVLHSVSDDGSSATVIGTDEIMTYMNGVSSRIIIDQIASISSSYSLQEKQKADLDMLAVEMKDSSKNHLPTESGKACFAVWSILLMLQRLQRN